LKGESMEETLASVVKKFRVKEMGKTQIEFAKQAGMTAPTLSAVEKGFKPSLKTYEKLALIMGLKAKSLRELKTKRRAK